MDKDNQIEIDFESDPLERIGKDLLRELVDIKQDPNKISLWNQKAGFFLALTIPRTLIKDK